MRALATTCLLLATLLTFPGSAEAQLSRLLGFENAPARRQSNAGRVGGEQAISTPATEQVQPVQFMEAIPSAASEAAPAMDNFDSGTPPMDIHSYDAPAPPPGVTAESTSVLRPAPLSDATVVSEVEASEVLTTPATTETILSTEYGQPYDIPLGDVISSEATEVYSTNINFIVS